METGRAYNKGILSNTGQGLTNSGESVRKIVEPINFSTSTSVSQAYAGNDEGQKVLTGSGEGDYVGASENFPHRWGHTAPSGSRVEIDDTGGAERISIVHKSGAAMVVDPDGSVYITSASKRGGGIGAPFGDYFISAGGDIVIKGGGSISVDTPGDLNLNVGGTLNITAGAYNLHTKTMDETIDGTAARSVTNDQGVVIGGILRTVVAGDRRDQTSGNTITDVAGKNTVRIDGEQTVDVGGKASLTADGGIHNQTLADHIQTANGKTQVNTGGDMEIKTAGENKFGSQGDAHFVSDGSTTVSGQSDTTIFSGAAVKLTGSQVNASPMVDRADWSAQSDKATILAAAVEPPESSGSGSSASGPSGGTNATEAKTMEANDIVDELTSTRQFPEYPGNGVHESASKTSLGMISGDETPQAEDVYSKYSSGNQGSIDAAYPGETVDTLPDTPVNRDANIAAVDSDIGVPSRNQLNAKISKHFTLGMLIKANSSHFIPQNLWEIVVKNHILVAVNVLDPLKEKFPDLVVTSAYRNNSANHKTGRAIDCRVESRSMSKNAEMARYARDNLPVDQVLLEKNDTGYSHLHVRVSPTGSKSNPVVFTCGDKKCNSKTPGIDVAFLMRKGTKG